LTDASRRRVDPPAQSPVRDSGGPVEGVRGNREVPPTTEEAADSLVDIAALQAERDDLFDRLQRLAAEFDNYRKRSARDAASLTVRANERLVKELLPILDDLWRALEAAEDHEDAKLEEGVRLVHRALADLLLKEGLAEIETDGTFDPHVHEALLSQPSDADEGSVIEVVQKGYKLGDRVLRPARVVVAAKPAAEPPLRDSGPGEGAPGGSPAPREE
jgi:molecular chaperone GrpE